MRIPMHVGGGTGDGRARSAAWTGCLVPLVALLASCAGGSNVDGAAIMARAKAATGGPAWDQIVVWHETGAITDGKRVQHYEHWENFRSLATRNAGDSPGQYMVFDGRVAYVCANAKCTRQADSVAAVVRNGAYATSFGFFFSNRFPASFHFQGMQRVHGSQLDVIRVSPVGFNPIRLWIDRNSHLITRIVYEDGEPAIDLSDYRKVSGVMVPFVATDGTTTTRTETLRFEQDGAVSFSPATAY